MSPKQEKRLKRLDTKEEKKLPNKDGIAFPP